MNQIRTNKTVRSIILSLLLAVTLLLTTSCVAGNEATLIENILKTTAEMGGKATFETESGETITITVTKNTQTEGEDDAVNEVQDEDKECSDEKDSSDSEDLADILPSLNCIEDVFKTLGKWEDAAELREKGLVWSHIAEELGFNKETMYGELEEIIEERLHHAEELGLLTHEKVEYKFKYFSDKAMKWTNKIFTDTGKDSSENLAEILPSLNSIEDVFKTLGKWEDAAELREMDLSWAHVARELDYDEARMYGELEEIIEESLRHAKELGLINQDQLEYKYNHFNELALKWINKIFAE